MPMMSDNRRRCIVAKQRICHQTRGQGCQARTQSKGVKYPGLENGTALGRQRASGAMSVAVAWCYMRL